MTWLNRITVLYFASRRVSPWWIMLLGGVVIYLMGVGILW